MDLEKEYNDMDVDVDSSSNSTTLTELNGIKTYSVKLYCDLKEEIEELSSVELEFKWEKKEEETFYVNLNPTVKSVIGDTEDENSLYNRIIRAFRNDTQIKESIKTEQNLIFTIEPILSKRIYWPVPYGQFPSYKDFIAKGGLKLLARFNQSDNIELVSFIPSTDWLFEKEMNSEMYKNREFFQRIIQDLKNDPSSVTVLKADWCILKFLYQFPKEHQEEITPGCYINIAESTGKCIDPKVEREQFYNNAVNRAKELFSSDQQVLTACLNVFSLFQNTSLVRIGHGLPFMLYKDMEKNIVAVVQEWHKEGRRRDLEKCIENAVYFTTGAHETISSKDNPYPTDNQELSSLLYKLTNQWDFIDRTLEEYGKELFCKFPDVNELRQLYIFLESKMMGYFKIPEGDLATRRSALYSLNEQIKVQYTQNVEPITCVLLQGQELKLGDFRGFIKAEVGYFVAKICEMRAVVLKIDGMVV